MRHFFDPEIDAGGTDEDDSTVSNRRSVPDAGVVVYYDVTQIIDPVRFLVKVRRTTNKSETELRKLTSHLDLKLLGLRECDLRSVGDARDLEPGAGTLYVVKAEDGCRKRIQVIAVKEVRTGKQIRAGLSVDAEELWEDEKVAEVEVRVKAFFTTEQFLKMTFS